jgi:signal transduction histidine kinase
VIDPSQQALSDFKSLLIESKMYTTNWVFLRANSDDKEALQTLHIIKYPRLKSRLTGLFGQLNNKMLADSLNQIFREFDELLIAEKGIMNSLESFQDYDDPVAKLGAEQIVEDVIIPRTTHLINMLEIVAANQRRIKDREYHNLELFSRNLRSLIILISVVILITGIVLSSYLTQLITRPINNIIKMVIDLGKGELKQVDLPQNKDEIGNMVRAVNELSRKLRETAIFADETGKQNFSLKFTPLGDKDMLGKALLTMRDNLKGNQEKLKHTAENLIHRNKELEQFTYIISHNLRAPVANIMGICQILDMGTDNQGESDQLIGILQVSVAKLNEVIMDLNHVLQVRQQVHEQMEKVNFSVMVDDIKQIFKNYLEDGEVDIQFDFKSANHTQSLKSYIYSILYNLISNSIKYKQLNTNLLIQLTTYAKGDKIIIVVQDNGKGIDLNKNGVKLFGLYNRFDTTVDGKGIGLYMVKTQVETLGGCISVESAINVGTTFRIELPKNS